MILDINLKKKKQRHKAAKKRFLLKQSVNQNDLLFEKTLKRNYWFNKSKVVASFLSIKSEIPTTSLNKLIWKLGKILCLPVITNDNEERLIFKQFKPKDNLIVGKFGVKEPLDSDIYLPDIIFTPCLAYDKFGFRLGYGGGYYDKTISYLYSINHNFLTIGLAYDDQKIDKVVHDHLDQKLNYILTEKQLYKIL